MRQKRLAKVLALSWCLPLLLWSYQVSSQYSIQTFKERFAGDGSIPFINYNGASFSYFDRDKQGNIYLADQYSGVIAKRDNLTGAVTLVTTVSQCAALAIDSADNLYVGQGVNVFKVSGNPAVLTNVAGNGTGATSGDGGPATAAGINIAFDVAVDKARNRMYILQQVGRIRQVDLTTGTISTVVGGPTNAGFTYTGNGGAATAATLGRRQKGITTDTAGNIYFASEFGVSSPNYRILKVTLATGVITSIAGNGTSGFSGDGGPATAASIGSAIAGITVDNAGNVYFIDGNRIRKIDAGGIITTIAGTGIAGTTGDGGPAAAAQITVTASGLGGDLILDATNTYLYLSQNVIPRIRRIHLASGVISEVNTLPPGIAANGDGGKAVDVYSVPEQFEGVLATSLDTGAFVYISERSTGRIRKVNRATNIITTAFGSTPGFSGDGGPAANAQFSLPSGMASDHAGNLYIADRYNNRIRKIDAATGIISTVAGNGGNTAPLEGAVATATALPDPSRLAVDTAGNLFVICAGNKVYKVTATTGSINRIAGVAGVDTGGYNGDGILAVNALLNNPYGIAVDPAGNVVVSDRNNQRIRKIDRLTGIISTITGTGVVGSLDGFASTSQLNYPNGIAYDALGNLLIADQGNSSIRMLRASDNKVYTVAAGFFTHSDVSVAPDGMVYIVDNTSRRVMSMTDPVIVLPGAAKIRLKVLLQGALLGNIPAEAALMRDNLRSSPLASGTTFIPTADPYSVAPLSASFTELSDGLELGYRTIARPAVMFGDSATSSVVDWIFVELREKNNPDSVLSTRSVLVRRNGLTLDALGNDTLYFPSLPAADQYYVSVRHRNHLGAMTAAALPSSTFDGSTLIDFTTMTNAQLWNNTGYDGLEQATVAPGVKALWAGNTNADIRVRFSGVGNDVGGIQSSVQNFSGNTAQSLTYTQAIGYFTGDVNMDSRARYSGIGNDPAWIQSLIQNYISNTSQSLVFTGFLQQLP